MKKASPFVLLRLNDGQTISPSNKQHRIVATTTKKGGTAMEPAVVDFNNTNKFDNTMKSVDLPRIAVGKLDGHDGPVTSVRFVPTTTTSTNSKKGGYCLTSGHDCLVKLWNPFRIDPVALDNHIRKRLKQQQTKKRPRDDNRGDGGNINNINDDETSISPYDDLPSCLEIQTYKFFAHEISALNSCGNLTSSSSHDTLLAASKNTFVVADLVTNSVIRRLGSSHHTGRINDICAFDGGNGSTQGQGGIGSSQVYVTASYDATVAIWDGRARNNHKPIQVLHDATDSVSCVLVGSGSNNDGSSSTNEAIVRTGSIDGIVRTYDVRKGLLTSDSMGQQNGNDKDGCYDHADGGVGQSTSSSSSPITSMAMTHDGTNLVVNCLDGTIRLMDVDTGELMNTYSGSHTSGSYGLDVSVLASDTTIATGSEDGTCVLYDIVSAKPVQRLVQGIAAAVATAATTTTSTRTATTSAPRRPTCHVTAHPKQNSVLITASYDNSVIVWSDDQTQWWEQHQHQSFDE
jgi:mitogen-activated protein kinase organizer 1